MSSPSPHAREIGSAAGRACTDGAIDRSIVFRVAHESSKAIKMYLGGGEKKK